MYAIFEAKGKQWRAEEGATIKLPSLDAEPGERVVFDRVLLADRGDEVLVGRPTLENASVAVEVTEHGKGDKIIVFKRKRRKNYRRKYGHRQPYTEVRVVDLDLEDATAPLPAEPGEEIDVTGAAEELAEEHDVDLTAVEGTGKDGRILKADVEELVEAAEEPAREAEDAPEAAAETDEGPGAVEEIDVTGAAEELAEEHDVDLTAVEGTGKDGRILKADVESAIKERGEE